MFATSLQCTVISPTVVKTLKMIFLQNGDEWVSLLMYFSFSNWGRGGVSFILPRTKKKHFHSTICQLPLETFNTNKIYRLGFQRMLPENSMIAKSVLKCCLIHFWTSFDIYKTEVCGLSQQTEKLSFRPDLLNKNENSLPAQ